MRSTIFRQGGFNAKPLIVGIALAMLGQSAVAAEQSIPFNIPPQALGKALNRYADAADVQLSYPASLIADLKSPGVSGQLTATQALQQLLGNTGIIARTTENGTVTLAKDTTDDKPSKTLPPSSNSTTLPAVSVSADAMRDVTDPYNQDYVLPNATAGTKTDTPIMETPLNVQVISKQVLKDQQVINLGDALKNVSGVTSNTTGTGALAGATDNNSSITLRGFQSDTFFRNGFRLQQGVASRGMANVESVEVLKGAAAILYGLVEPGGMVNVITKQPLATPYYGFSQQFGSYDLYRTTIDATGPLTKNKDLLYRMNMSYENSGSFREFVNKEDVFLAPVLKWNISPQTQATFELEYNHKHAGLDGAFVPLLNGKALNVPFGRNYGDYSPSTTETIFGGFNWSHQFNEDWAIKHRFSVNQITNSANPFILPFAFDTVSVNRFLYSFNTQNNTYATNLDLTGHFDTGCLKHTLLLGGDYYRLDSTRFTAVSNDISQINFLNPVHSGNFASSLQVPNYINTTQTDQYGLYIQDQIKLPYGFHVMGGIRYQYIHQNDLFQNFGSPPATASVQTQDAVTPRVGILWQPKSWVSLYANYVESFGANTGIIFPDKVPPPTSAEQYEGGIKTEFFDGRLRATLAYYDLTKTNVATANPDPALAIQGFIIATGAVRSRGPELDIQGEILPGWNMIATYSNTDIVVTKGSDSNANLNIPVGSRLPNVPRNTGSLWNTYEIQEGDLKGLKFGGGATFRDGQIGCCDTPNAKIPGYATVDLLAAYSRNIGKTKVTAQLNINNLLNKHYYTGIFTTGNGLAGFQPGFVDFGQPRTLMGSINIQY